jgi:hypothetical protein
MSRWLAALSWLAVFPYAYVVFFLGCFVDDTARTPQTAAVLFWAYLAVYPVAVVVFNLLAWRLRSVGQKGWALVVSLLPYGVLAAAWFAFPVFVKTLCRVFV